MTSNVGSDLIADMRPVGFESKNNNGLDNKKELIQKKIDQALKETFKPEFLNRIDEIITFNYLGSKEIRQIVDLELNKVEKRLMKSKEVKASFSKELREHLAQAGFDPDLGARPLRRIIQRKILDPLALQVVAGELMPDDNVMVGWKDEQVVFEHSRSRVKNKKKK